MVQYDYIRMLYFNEGLAQRAIAKSIETLLNGLLKEIQIPISGDFVSKVKAMLLDNKVKPRKER